jgi:glycerophosphoryl diester phosphodiesterase
MLRLGSGTLLVATTVAAIVAHGATQSGPAGAGLASLVGIARLAPDTFGDGPASGAFRDNGARGQAFPAQPVQGVSSILPDESHPGWFFALSDNGYGVRWNSPDYLLCFYRLRPVWRTAEGGSGTVEVGETVRLSDARTQAPFRIVREDSTERWLTGSDFDPEAFVRMPDGSSWIGDEFGPYLLHVDAAGRLLAPPAGVPGLVSADRPGLPPPDAGAPNPATVRRSRGFESLARVPGSSMLLALLEGPTTEDPADRARILEFDPGSGTFTGRRWWYPFDVAGNSATELVPYGPGRYLVIERDNLHGPKAAFKRVFAIRVGEPDSVVGKTLVVDLLSIADPHRVGGQAADVFTFPYITTEAVWVEDERTLVLVNDNNYPATGGRVAGERDGTEFIRLRLSAPLPR